jgi:DNA ligase-1
MNTFLRLLEDLERNEDEARQREVLSGYFSAAPPVEAVAAIGLLLGRGLGRPFTSATLRAWAGAAAGLPVWLVDECVQHTGDAAEALALLLPEADAPGPDLPTLLGELLPALLTAPPDAQPAAVQALWPRLPPAGRLLVNRLLLGSWRAPVPRAGLARALARPDLPAEEIEHRLLPGPPTDPAAWSALLAPAAQVADPFRLLPVRPLACLPETLGDRAPWQVEWLWRGERLLLHRRADEVRVLHRHGDTVTDRQPDLVARAQALPAETVLDLLLPSSGGPPRLLDTLALAGRDLRPLPLAERRLPFDEIARATGFLPSEPLPVGTWADLASWRSRARGLEAVGLVLKRLDAPYAPGFPPDWLAWRAEALRVRALLLYVQPAPRPGADGEEWEFTFGVRGSQGPVPIVRLTAAPPPELEASWVAWLRRHTVESFGPVRQVRPVLGAELEAEALAPAPRGKAGVTLEKARVVAWLPQGLEEYASLKVLRAAAGWDQGAPGQTTSNR